LEFEEPETVAESRKLWEWERLAVVGLTATEIALILTIPFAPVIDPSAPFRSTSTGFDNATTGLPLAVGESCRVKVATTPLLRGVEVMPAEFTPANKHVWFAQYNALFADTAAGLAAMLKDATSEAGQFKVHCSPAELPG